MSSKKPNQQRDLDSLLRMAAAEGARVALETLEKKKRAAQASRYDKRLYNTGLLLRNYRAFNEAAENAVFDAAGMDENAVDILDLMMDTDSESLAVESIKKSAARTAIIVAHVKRMVEIYEILCERSGKMEEQRRYRVVYAFYIDKENHTAEELAEVESINQRTVYKDIDAAKETLTSLIFGIDGIKMM